MHIIIRKVSSPTPYCKHQHIFSVTFLWETNTTENHKHNYCPECQWLLMCTLPNPFCELWKRNQSANVGPWLRIILILIVFLHIGTKDCCNCCESRLYINVNACLKPTGLPPPLTGACAVLSSSCLSWRTAGCAWELFLFCLHECSWCTQM